MYTTKAVQTFQTLAGHKPPQAEPLDGLTNRDWGDWDGLPAAEACPGLRSAMRGQQATVPCTSGPYPVRMTEQSGWRLSCPSVSVYALRCAALRRRQEGPWAQCQSGQQDAGEAVLSVCCCSVRPG